MLTHQVMGSYFDLSAADLDLVRFCMAARIANVTVCSRRHLGKTSRDGIAGKIVPGRHLALDANRVHRVNMGKTWSPWCRGYHGCGLCDGPCEANTMPAPGCGHGHVYPMPNGLKARCGGPAICSKCAADAIEAGLEVPGWRQSAKELVASSKAGLDVLIERRRQVEEEGYSPEHDDGHINGELALAAIAYASPLPVYVRTELIGETIIEFRDPWPWAFDGDKRRDDPRDIRGAARDQWVAWRRQLLVQAAALLIAEIERLDRAEALVDKTIRRVPRYATEGS
jgi:hypothetical protein